MTILSRTNDEMQDTIKHLKIEMPGWNISFGYIGNIWQSPYRDDRSWKIWLRPKGIMTFWEWQDSFSINHTTEGKDRTSHFDFNEEYFFAWIEKQKNRYKDYIWPN